MESSSRLPGILIYGTGGHAKVVASTIRDEGKYRLDGFVTDATYGDTWDETSRFLGLPVYMVSSLPSLRRMLPSRFIVGIGDNFIRRTKHLEMESLGFQPTTIIHPFSSIAGDAVIGDGSVICPGAVINPDVKVGEGAIVNVHAGIGHDSRVDDFVHISANAALAGNCSVGELGFIAIGATVLPGIQIGRNALVAAGAVVTKHIPADMLAIGSPARCRVRELPCSPSDAIFER